MIHIKRVNYTPPLHHHDEETALSLYTAEGLSFGGYTGLKGSIVTVTVTKVSRKLGIAVEGGATTKNQKGVVIRQITVSELKNEHISKTVQLLLLLFPLLLSPPFLTPLLSSSPA